MKHPKAPHHVISNAAFVTAFKPLVHALLLCGVTWGVHAQTAVQPPSMRERTRQNIEAVRADQPGALDDARGLGNLLDVSGERARAQVWRERAQGAGAVETPLPLPGVTTGTETSNGQRYQQQIQWPESRPAGARRVLQRPPSNTEMQDASRMAFTPDFSRQRLTLGGMAGRTEIDLPQQDLVDLNPKQALTMVDVNPADALSLPDLVNIGLDYSPVMDQALSQLDAAVNRRKQARADLLPRFSLRLGQGSERSTGVNVSPPVGTNRHNTYSDAFRLTQPVFNLPLISDWMVELSNERAANWRLQVARESVALAVTQATLNLAAARLVMEYSDEQLSNFSRLLDYVQARSQAGAASTADLERTRTRVLLARQTRIEQQANYKNALLDLQRLTGQSPTGLRLPFLNQLPGLPATNNEMRRVVWNQSYDLRALRADIEAQRRAVSSSQQKLLPVVGLSLEQDASRNVRGENPKQVDTRVMGVMTWEFSLGGKEFYGAGAAAAELSNREAKLTEQGERLLQQIDADFASLQSASLRIAAGQGEQLASAAVVASVNEQLRIGRIGSLLEALDAYERHFGARQRLTLTLTQQMQAQAQLLARMGMLSNVQRAAQTELAPKSQAPAVETLTAPSPAMPAQRVPEPIASEAKPAAEVVQVLPAISTPSAVVSQPVPAASKEVDLTAPAEPQTSVGSQK